MTATALLVRAVDLSPFAEHVDAWRAGGWRGAFPLPAREKYPPPSGFTGATGRDPTDDEIDEWKKRPDSNIGLRMPALVVGLDVDGYKPASAESFARLTETCGPLPATYVIRNRGDDTSGTYLFQLAEPTKLIGGVPGIDVIQRDHRYQVAPGSVHPDGRVYRLYGPDREETDVPPRPEDLPLLSPSWVDELREDKGPRPPRGSRRAQYRRAERVAGEWAPSVNERLGAAFAELHSGVSRHDVATRTALALLNYEHAEYPGASDALELFGDAFMSSIADRATPAEARAEWERMVTGGREKIARNPPTIQPWREWNDGQALFDEMVGADSPASSRRAPAAADPTIAPTLPEWFYDERDAFKHISQSARHFQVGPDAVFYGVLARVVAYTHPFLGLPEMPRFGSLNLIVNLVGPSGTGKGASTDRAKQLVALPGDLTFVEVPAGSGEGMVRSFFTKQDIDGDGKRSEWRQTIQSVLFRVDEGRFLKALGERSGQTTLDVLLSGFSGEQLGGNYTDPDKRGIIVRPHSYRMVVITGIQPENAQFMLDDVVSGFPQRMLWAACIDPGAPAPYDRPDDPGRLPWNAPEYRSAETVLLTGNTDAVEQRHALAIAPAIADEIMERRYLITSGRAVPDPLDSHRDLVRLKVAGALALLDERVDIDADDWRLSGVIVDTSNDVRAWVQQTIRAQHARDETHAVEKVKRRAAAAEDGRAEQATIERKAVAMARWARGRGSVSKRDLSHRLKSSERQGMFDRVLGLLLAREWLRPAPDDASRYESTATAEDGEEWPL